MQEDENLNKILLIVSKEKILDPGIKNSLTL